LSIIESINESTPLFSKADGVLTSGISYINGIYNFWPTFSGDDFSGTNGDPPNTDLWTEMLDEGVSATIQSDALNFDSPGGNSNYRNQFNSRFGLSGDFSIQIDFSISSLTAPTDSVSHAAYFRVNRASDNANMGYISRGRDTTTNKYWSDGASVSSSTFVTTDSSGQFKITRVSGVIKVFQWDSVSSRWEWNGSTAGRQVTNSETGNLYILLYFEQENNSTVDSSIDNFVINSGTVVAPLFL